MAEKYENFKSQTEINIAREQNRKARQLILENAKHKFEVNEAKKEKARRQGEGTWMLDSVSNRISREEKNILKAKKKSKKKKKKKKRKSSDSSPSHSDEDEVEEWVDAPTAGITKGPQLQRESWMEAPVDLIPTTSRQEIRAAINKSKEEARREAEKAQEPGQHSRELNPYWRDGGTGLPEEKLKKPPSGGLLAPSSAGDGGLSWLQKARTRCVQEAQNRGCSLEEVAAERYGSLKKLEEMIEEARQKMRDAAAPQRFREGRNQQAVQEGGRMKGSREGRRDRSGSRERRRDKSGSGERRRDRSGSRERRRDRSGSRERRRDRSGSRERRRDRSGSRERRRDRSGSRERRRDRSGERRRDRSLERKRDRSGSIEKREGSKSNGRMKRGEEIGSRDNRLRFRRPDSEEEEEQGSYRRFQAGHEKSSGRSGFMRPTDSERTDQGSRGGRELGKDVPRWKKRTEIDVGKSESEKDRKCHEDAEDSHRKEGERKQRRKSRSPSPSSESSDDGGSSEAEQEPPAKVLSEEELNDLAAKILRAEIMGEDEMAAELKSKLEAARQLRAAAKPREVTGDGKGHDFSHRRRLERERNGEEEEDGVVVLSRTGKGGMVRPVLGSTADHRAGGTSSRKRKKAASTHDVSGERTIYFDDDNKFDLKSLVEQEKAGTAEDQNAMFARLAGRSDDRDLDVDDMFVSKAARKQNEEGAASRDRSAAIFEHRKMSAAMEKCGRCFDKVPKHLIVAIGTKSYLCLPGHRSLTEGHCLIVPMQHATSCTAIDEDVWREMQLFRKSLVQMFLSEDEDVVVMETVMHLKHFPHTAIECIPLEKETGDLAPIYFKKAIQEVGPEWSDNKKLHSLREKDVRRVIPNGFPYFSVDFGLQGGYATVIEDEQTFPPYFGREIVGGMIDAEPALWRKPHKQSFEDQRQKVLKFEQKWRRFDWTQNLGVGD